MKFQFASFTILLEEPLPHLMQAKRAYLASGPVDSAR